MQSPNTKCRIFVTEEGSWQDCGRTREGYRGYCMIRTEKKLRRSIVLMFLSVHHDFMRQHTFLLTECFLRKLTSRELRLH